MSASTTSSASLWRCRSRSPSCSGTLREAEAEASIDCRNDHSDRDDDEIDDHSVTLEARFATIVTDLVDWACPKPTPTHGRGMELARGQEAGSAPCPARRRLEWGEPPWDTPRRRPTLQCVRARFSPAPTGVDLPGQGQPKGQPCQVKGWVRLRSRRLTFDPDLRDTHVKTKRSWPAARRTPRCVPLPRVYLLRQRSTFG